MYAENNSSVWEACQLVAIFLATKIGKNFLGNFFVGGGCASFNGYW